MDLQRREDPLNQNEVTPLCQSIHPNGRNFDKRYPAAGDGKIRRKAMKRLNARRLDHAATVAKKTEGYRMPGSMAR